MSNVVHMYTIRGAVLFTLVWIASLPPLLFVSRVMPVLYVALGTEQRVLFGW